jgi:hypothetical protein
MLLSVHYAERALWKYDLFSFFFFFVFFFSEGRCISKSSQAGLEEAV